jgi:hypothetical protein
MKRILHAAILIVASATVLLADGAFAVERPGDGPYREYSYAYFMVGLKDLSPFGSVDRYFGATQSADCDRTGKANPTIYRESPGSISGGNQYRDFIRDGDDDDSERIIITGSRNYPQRASSFRATIEADPAKSGLNWTEPPQQFRYFISPSELYDLPAPGVPRNNTGFDAGPAIRYVSPRIQSFRIDLPLSYEPSNSAAADRPLSFTVPRSNVGSINVPVSADRLPQSMRRLAIEEMKIGVWDYTTVSFDGEYDTGYVINALEISGITYEFNWCRRKLVPNDPNYTRTARNGGGSWGQAVDDQWAIKRVGYTDSERSAWNAIPETAEPVVVAVIDTGLDWHHRDIDWENLWRNPDEIPDNGLDDDNNGYIDDIIGWDFLAQMNKPWDMDGHGTVVAGIIAATRNNDIGIAGISDHAQIMVLKAVNNFGSTRASYIAQAIVYAVDNGARIINLSVGGPRSSAIEQAALAYASDNNVLVIAASGNEGIELDDYGPGGDDNVLTVGATHVDDRAAGFSNYGASVDLVAPGVDVVSLRARYTDTNFPADGSNDYQIGDNYVGDDKRYLHVSGTSFSAPIVTATASLILAKNPQLSAAEVRHILLQSAEDIEFPGRDDYTGSGMLDASTALRVGPDFFVEASIDSVQLVTVDKLTVYQVKGTADAENFKRAWLQIGSGENPGSWKYVGSKLKFPVKSGMLASIPPGAFRGSVLWQVLINVEHKNGTVRRSVYSLEIE